jgi:hypothetical protein
MKASRKWQLLEEFLDGSGEIENLLLPRLGIATEAPLLVPSAKAL